ncbi:MAG: NMD3-related protein [Candidatus Altiarchaeota archaeon]
MLCYRCGKETKKSLCEECFLELNPIKLKEIKLIACDCGRYKQKNIWKENKINSVINKVVLENLILPKGASIKKLFVDVIKTERNKIIFEVKASVKFNEKEILNFFTGEIKLDKQLCNTCRKLKSYEAILQFRGFEPNIKEIDTNLISKIEKTNYGLDIYIINKGYARKIAKKFKKIGYDTKESQKLFGIDESGRRKSRITISIRKK